MVDVGNNTDSDLNHIFEDLYKGMKEKKLKLNNPVCKWKCCDGNEVFSSVEILLSHVKQHIESADISIAPVNRQYICCWEECNKTFKSKHLIENHLRDHTGNSSDDFFEILLKDQAKALKTPARQMKWHPLVIRWCLQMYSKSHYHYEDMRESGFLKLPSGRTLSDYKNYSSAKSGWQTSMLETMKSRFVTMKIGKQGILGGLFFDEVKIKEGLLFDPSTWELIGFTDIEEDIQSGLPSPAAMQETKEESLDPHKNVATHVLQFFYKSICAKFEFPCAHFLTRGVTAQKLNRIFWQGVSLLHGYGFEILLACCDGAPENRAFFAMNGTNKTKSQGNNPYSKMPIYFISDPPHLMKKLRNNLHKSGYKEKSKRYTRLLQLGSKYILWDHIYSVHEREKHRRLYTTDLRRSHIYLDNLSKMRVKLAVQTLSKKVQQEMSIHKNQATEATQKYISNCEKMWNVFNDNRPLRSVQDERVTILDDALTFFTMWKENLAQQYKKKAERASHFITWQTMFDIEVCNYCNY
jgi:hypothetical protein